jgi:glycosyltransferase involved in cell wall biosynthesis
VFYALDMTSIPPLTLCIPTYRRWAFIQKNLPKYLENPYIHEIVICDETGEDVREIQRAFENHPKLKCFVNEKKLGPFLNKRKAVSHASNPWICLMDSDNFAPLSYFEAWAAFVQKEGIESKVIYSPSRTLPQDNHPGFDYRHFIGKEITLDNCKENYAAEKGECLFNTGNYILCKSLYKECTNEQLTIASRVVEDVLFQNYLFFSNANAVLRCVPDMEYNHIVHQGSFYTNNCSASQSHLVLQYFR